MFWQEDEDKTLPWEAPDDILDISFTIRCKYLPQDHNWALATAIQAHLPWIGQDRCSGIHSIHVAADANGWHRPEDGSGQLLIPSRRTRLILRVTQQQLPAAQQLSGSTLDIAGYELTLGPSRTRPLQNAAVVFARYVLADEHEAETAFLERIAADIQTSAQFEVKKMLCGKSHYLHTPNGPRFARHLMIADLDNEASVHVQQYGLGTDKALGCGLFLPHKGIKTLKPTE